MGRESIAVRSTSTVSRSNQSPSVCAQIMRSEITKSAASPPRTVTNAVIDAEMNGIQSVPVLRRAERNVSDLLTIKDRLGVSSAVDVPDRVSIWNHHHSVHPMVSTVSMSSSTWTLRGNGYGVCSGGIWSGDHFQCIQSEEVLSSESVRSVNTAESSISAETPNEDILVNESEQCAPKRKRKRTRRRRRRKE